MLDAASGKKSVKYNPQTEDYVDSGPSSSQIEF